MRREASPKSQVRRAASPESHVRRESQVRLGERLVQHALVLPHQVDDALARQKESGGRLGRVLVDLGAVQERDMVGVLAKQIGVPAADLRHETPEPDVISLLAEDVAREFNAIPLRRDDGSVTVAVADPQSDDVRKGVETAVRERVRFVIAPTSDIERAINNCYRALDGVSLLIKTFNATDTSRPSPVAAVDTDATVDDAPVIRLVNLVIMQALRDRASDVHIEPHPDEVRVRF
ncbi:MAG TPA: hypothetical protein VKJ07_24905, partial [Mycobacteriales bacterium]|nr:hypothetical protein [Mycobacteriales bacterium]